MSWVIWRQHRVALVGVAAFLGAVFVLFWIAGIDLHHAHSVAINCRPESSFACGVRANEFNGAFGFLANGILPQVVPALIGAFLGAPLLAREFETGTFRFSWTQAFGRSRWTLAKLVAPAMAVAAPVAALSALFSWYYAPYFATANAALSLRGASSLDVGLFDLRGVTFAAWTVCALAIGGLAGVLVRQVVPAIAATLAVYTGLAVATAFYLRQHYLTPLVTSRLDVPGSAWIIRQRWLTQAGRPVSTSVLGRILQTRAPQLAGKGGVPKSLSSWQYLTQHGYRLWTTYQPASRFWPMQWIEGGWLIALSALLIASTVWIVRRRAS